MKQTLFFDLDDTLIHCNKYFYLTIDRFVADMLVWFGADRIDEEEVRAKHMELDIAGIHALGFQSDRFPQSFIETYRHYAELTGRRTSAREEDRLWRLGRSVYDHEAEPYPHMAETLDALARAGHELHLYTGGEPLIQHRKIARLGLERYFESRIYVRQHKNVDALEHILTAGGQDRDHTWMIGNSIRTDVVPALTAGIHAIHMKTDAEWIYNLIDIEIEPRGAFLTLRQLAEVPDAITGYVSGAQRSS
ncbi:HAD family hydrolase [Paenibacillus sp. IB182496]|uniref:HAD family hydrolase n=2 Tax=Paenibacillus sabuli TaxID=2772509 RepID=A0A927GU96_9BACL|nr:HAD family hydrolase [Paenibacillus sabuli]MBD2847935.1 HAD family hydrolase [Paenibacillus sabuli]